MKKKIKELFRLAMKAQEKTSAYVSFETSNHGWGCVVIIMDDGFETGREYDGYYPMDMFYPDETWVSCQRLHSNKRKGVCRE